MEETNNAAVNPEQESAEKEQQPNQESATAHETEKKRVLAALGYIPFLFFLPLLLRDKEKQNEFLIFHVRQGIVLTVIALILAVIGPILTIFVPIIGGIVAFALNTVLALVILVGAWRAYQGEMWELPYVGAYAKSIKI